MHDVYDLQGRLEAQGVTAGDPYLAISSLALLLTRDRIHKAATPPSRESQLATRVLTHLGRLNHQLAAEIRTSQGEQAPPVVNGDIDGCGAEPHAPCTNWYQREYIFPEQTL